MKKYFFLTCFIFITVFKTAKAQDDQDLLKFWQYYSDIENSLYKHHCSVAFKQLDLRKNEVEKLKTKSDYLARKKIVRDKLAEVVGPLPKRTPLNAKVTEVIKKDSYRVEKIIYQSIPDYFVTGALFIPDGVKKNAPAIFYACGHSPEGFRVDAYQNIIINLVKKGFVVFSIDPMGQGERYEYWNPTKNEANFIPDHEHSYAGAQCLISGYSIGKYFIWDVMRGIDYMLSRKEVDPKRIGMTGRSGGGNITAYLGALDDRLLATAPECYITNYKLLLKSVGPQCSEQNLYQMIYKGLDHADFIEARAPKPTMVIGTTRDFFSIEGGRESYLEAKKMYQTLDAGDYLSMTVDDDIHTSTKKNREAMYAFFQKQLNNPGSPKEIEVELLTPEELKVSKTGQISTSFEAQSIFSLNKAITEKQIEILKTSRLNILEHLKKTPSEAEKLSGFEHPKRYGESIFSGRHIYSDYILEKYLIHGSDNYVLPTLLLKPKTASKKEIVLMLDSEGLNHAIKKDSIALKLVKKGYSVLLFDLPGIGSMGPGYLKGDSYIDGVSYNQWFSAILTGRSHVSLRTEDILRLVHFVKKELKDYSSISAISSGPLGVELLHAVTFNSDIKNICLIKPFLSFSNIATTRLYKPKYIPFTVAGAIQSYDLPDLMANMKTGKLMIFDPVNAKGIKPTKEELDKTYAFPEKILNSSKNQKRFWLYEDASQKELLKHLLYWLE